MTKTEKSEHNEQNTVLSPEKSNKMMNMIDMKLQLAVLTLFIVIASVILWGFFGSVQRRVDAHGVLVKSSKIINIYTTDDTTILDFALRPDMYVEKDMVVARLDQSELVNEINLMILSGSPQIEIDAKREELIQKSQIHTYESGRVVNTYVHTGDYVGKGTKIATIVKEAPDSKATECLLYIPADKIKNVRKGHSVNVYPANINTQEYGYITGVVSYISEYPVTAQYMLDILGSEELGNEFMKQGACYEVTVNLTMSEDTVTGYEWTTSSGPEKKFGDLTMCDATVIIEKSRPFDIFFGNKQE